VPPPRRMTSVTKPLKRGEPEEDLFTELSGYEAGARQWERAPCAPAGFADLIELSRELAPERPRIPALRDTRVAVVTDAPEERAPREADSHPQTSGVLALAGLTEARRVELKAAIVEHAIADLEDSSGHPLPPELAEEMGQSLGHDFGHVRVHADDSAAEAAALFSARAFTLGAHIYMGRDQWQPGAPWFESLLAHELTHVVQHDHGELAPGPAGGVRVTAPDEASEREAAEAAAYVGNRELPAIVEDARNATAARPDAQGVVVARDVLPSLSDVVRWISPDLADLIEEGPLGKIQEIIEDGIDTFLSPFTGIIESVTGFVDGLIESFGDVFTFIQGLAAGDLKCCEAFAAGLDLIREIASAIADNPAVQALRDGLGKVSGVIKDIVVFVLSPGFELVKKILGGAWDGIKDFAETIGDWIDPVLEYSQAAFDWVMEKLGIGGDGGGGGGILGWLAGVADDAWSAISETFAPIVEPLKTVGSVLLAVSPIGPLMLLIKHGPTLVSAVQWLWKNRGDPNLVKRAHDEMGHTFLPGLLDGAQGFSQAMQSAATWLVDKITGLSTGLLELAGGLAGVPLLGLVQSAVQSVADGATQFAGWASGVFTEAVAGIQSGFDKLRAFVTPYIDVLCSIGLAIVNPAMIPMILFGHAWMALPDCIKAPIIDLLLDAAIAVLEALPGVALFGPLWAILRSGVIGFLRGLRKQDPKTKEQVSNKIARVLSGSSPAFLLGFVEGFLQGVWEGLTDPFVLIWTVIEGLGKVATWLVDLAAQALGPTDKVAVAPAPAPAAAPSTAGEPLPTRAELGERVGQMGAELAPHVEQVTGGFYPAVQSVFQDGQGLTFEDLIARLGEMWASVEMSVQNGSEGLAARLCEFFMRDEAEGELGKGVGWLAGTIAFEVLLTVLTAGAWEPVSAAGKALKVFARILDWTGEALGAAFKLIGQIGGFLLDALKGLRRMLASAAGPVHAVLDAIGEIGSKLVRYAEELLGRFGRGVANEGGEALAETGTKKALVETAEEVGEETAEKTAKKAAAEGAVDVGANKTAAEGTEEFGEQGAKQTTEEVGEQGAKETTEEAGEQGAKETAEEGGEQGGKRVDDAEKLRVAAEAKIVSDLLERSGIPAVAIASALERTFMPRYRWIKQFVAEARSPILAEIFMIASKIKVDDVRVDSPGGKSPDKIKEPKDAPKEYQSDPERLEELSKDPAKGGVPDKYGKSTREAMAGLAAERKKLVKPPVKRGPPEVDFFDGDGIPWDVKTPISPPAGAKWTFTQAESWNSVVDQLKKKWPNANTGTNQPVRVLLDVSYLNKQDHELLWQQLKKRCNAEELSRIVEIIT
jgi:hypothetical protein